MTSSLLQGDCREVLKTLNAESVTACVTDPPYNYEFIGHNWNASEAQRRIERANGGSSKTLVKNIPYGSGLAGGVRNRRWYERNRQNIVDYGTWCEEWGREVFRVCKPGATIAVFNSTRTVAHVQTALENVGFYARDILVYRRSSGIPKGANIERQLKKKGHTDAERWRGWHSCFRGEWEAICILQKPLKNNYAETFEEFGTGLFYTQTGDGGFQSNILEGITREKNEDFNVHCTVKPLELMQKLIHMLVPPVYNATVLDPFAGSGTTLVAAQTLGIEYVGIESVKEYIDVCQARLRRAIDQQGTLDLAL